MSQTLSREQRTASDRLSILSIFAKNNDNMPGYLTGVKKPIVKFNDGGSMEDMMRSMQMGKGPSQSDQPKEPEFRMTGQEASSVMMDGDREYVMYDPGVPGQDPIKVYGNWNEYAVDRDENGNDMIADEDYPITKNENGEYVLDETLYEATGPNRNADERMVAGKARKEAKSTGQSGTSVLLEMLNKRRGPR